MRLEEAIAARAKVKQATSTGGSEPQLKQKSAEAEKVAGVSHDTVTKVKRIEANASPELKAKLAKGEIVLEQILTDPLMIQADPASIAGNHRSGHTHDSRVIRRQGEERPGSDHGRKWGIGDPAPITGTARLRVKPPHSPPITTAKDGRGAVDRIGTLGEAGKSPEIGSSSFFKGRVMPASLF